MVNITMLVANRPRLTKQALDSIGDLSDATVTIRDACMNPDVAPVVRDWAVDKAVSYISSPDPLGTGPARNAVVDASERLFGRGDYLYLSDEDVFWKSPNWLSTLIAAYDDVWSRGFRVLAAYNHPFNCPIGEMQFILNRPDLRVYEVYAVATQSMLMRWSVWDEFGPFCDTPAGKVCQSEDVAFCNKIRAAGYKVGVVSPALLVNCGITNSFGEKIPGWEAVLKERVPGVYVE